MYQIYRDIEDNTYVGFFEDKVTVWGCSSKEVLDFFKHICYRTINSAELLDIYEGGLLLIHETETIEELKLLILLES